MIAAIRSAWNRAVDALATAIELMEECWGTEPVEDEIE